MPTILEIRKQYPQYDDISDKDLVETIHTKFYSDLPFGEVAKKVGYISSPQDEVDTTTGLTNIPLRMKLSFIDDPNNAEKYLNRFYDSGRLPDGRLYYLNPETGKRTTVDEQGWSLKDLSDWAGMVPEIGYGTVGAIAGVGVPVPGATIVGAGLGTVAGKAVKKQIATGLLGETPKYNLTDQDIKDYLAAGAAGAAGEGVGMIGVKMLSPFAKYITPVHKRAVEFFKRYGGRLTPAQATEHRLLDTIEGVVEHSLFGGSKFREFRLSQDELSVSIADDIVNRFGNSATAEEAGLLVQKAIENKNIAFNKAANVLYKEVDRLAGGAQIDILPLKKEAQRLLKQLTPTKTEMIMEETTLKIIDASGRPITTTIPKQVTKKLVPSLKNKSTVRILEDFAKLPDEVPFQYLQQWRSDLMQVGFAPTDLIPGKTAGMAKHLSKTIDNTFTRAEGGLSGDALEAFRKANGFWKLGKEKFNNNLIKSVAKKDPELIAQTIFKPNAIQPIKKIKAMLGEETYKKIRGVYTNSLLFKESIENQYPTMTLNEIKNLPVPDIGMGPTGIISGNKLLNRLRGMGKSTLEEIYSKPELDDLFNFGNTLKLIQNRPPGTGGGMLIQLVQANAIMALPIGIATGFESVSGTAAMALLSPPVLARLFTNKHGIQWLTKGLVTKRGSKEGIKLANRIIAIVGKENLKIAGQPKTEFQEEPMPVTP